MKSFDDFVREEINKIILALSDSFPAELSDIYRNYNWKKNKKEEEGRLLFAINRNFYTNQMLIAIYRSITKMIIDLGWF